MIAFNGFRQKETVILEQAPDDRLKATDNAARPESSQCYVSRPTFPWLLGLCRALRTSGMSKRTFPVRQGPDRKDFGLVFRDV